MAIKEITDPLGLGLTNDVITKFNSVNGVYVDANIREDISGNVGIGTATPTSTFEINGSVSKSIVSKVATYLLTALDYTVEMDATTGNLIANLPTAVGIKGRIYVIAKTDVSINTVTVDPNGTEQIGKDTTIVLAAQDEATMIQSNGVNWREI